MIKRLNRVLLINLIVVSFLIFPSVSLSSQVQEKGLESMIERVEKAITKASDMFEHGQLQKGSPYIVSISQEIELSFSEATFEADIEKAFKILEQLMAKKNTLEGELTTATHGQGQYPPQSRAISPQGQSSDRLNALIQSEKETSKGIPPSDEKLNLEYSVHKSYQQTRQAKLQDEDKEAEADRQIIIAERQQAAQRMQMKREREQQLQAQASKWQDELDKQAKTSAQAALQWEKEHSFGAYAKKFLGMVIQTSVGAFTGGLLGTVSTNLANKAVSKLFPNVDTSTLSQAAAAGTSSAITGTASSIGQTASQAATSSITGQNQPNY